jgi:hypothetical protein
MGASSEKKTNRIFKVLAYSDFSRKDLLEFIFVFEDIYLRTFKGIRHARQ